MIKSDIKKGDIYYATLNPAIGSEQREKDQWWFFKMIVAINNSPTVISCSINKDNKKRKITNTYFNS